MVTRYSVYFCVCFVSQNLDRIYSAHRQEARHGGCTVLSVCEYTSIRVSIVRVKGVILIYSYV